MTACLGVILDINENTQKFFGGGEVDNKSKQVSSTKMSHNNDIESMNVNTSGGRQFACTGQVGKNAAVFTWDTTTGEKIRRVALGKGDRGVAAICISPDGSHVATADKHNDHNVKIWNMNSGEVVFGDKGGPDPIMDLAFTKQPGVIACWSVGVKHIAYWNPEKGKKKKGIFSGNPMTSFAAVTADDEGNAYAGASNSLIYKWAGNSCKGTWDLHGDRCFVGAIVWIDGVLYSGARDGRVNMINPGDMSVTKCFDFGCLPRAIDVKDGQLVVGLRTGAIVTCNLET